MEWLAPARKVKACASAQGQDGDLAEAVCCKGVAADTVAGPAPLPPSIKPPILLLPSCVTLWVMISTSSVAISLALKGRAAAADQLTIFVAVSIAGPQKSVTRTAPCSERNRKKEQSIRLRTFGRPATWQTRARTAVTRREQKAWDSCRAIWHGNLGVKDDHWTNPLEFLHNLGLQSDLAFASASVGG